MESISDSANRWIPLESNPDILNSWSQKVGLLQKDSFGDIYGLDDELLAMVPKRVKAVILLFPITEKLEAIKKQEDQELQSGGSVPVDSTVIWIKQNIGNACGTIGLLHALLNSPVTMVPESPLAQFQDQCIGKTPLERAQLLETTPLFASVHREEASSGQSAVPQNLDTNYHFTCFVQAPGSRVDQIQVDEGKRLIELDGRRTGPVDRGSSTDLLKDVASFVKERFIRDGGIDLNMMALSGSEGDALLEEATAYGVENSATTPVGPASGSGKIMEDPSAAV